MKRIVFIFLGLFSFMTMITNEHFCFDGQKALAQRMYSEPIDGGSFGDVIINGDYWPDNNGFDTEEDLWGDSDDGQDTPSSGNDNSDGEDYDSGSDIDNSSGDNSYSSQSSKTYCQGITMDEILKALWKSSDKIKQTGSTCSAAVLQKLLADTDPVLYRKIVLALYKTGKYEPWGIGLSDCYKNLKVSDVKNVYNKNERYDPVDLIMQCAFINKMNAIYDYNPLLDDGENNKGKIRGMQPSYRVRSFIENTMNKNVETIFNPELGDLEEINYNDSFVIAKVYYNNSNDDFEGTVFQQHYAQLTGLTSDKISYWSWGGNYKAKQTSINGVQMIFIVKK